MPDSFVVLQPALPILVILATLGLFAVLRGTLQRILPLDENPLVEAVDSLLPQTQCAQCGFPGCRPYAEAVVEGADLTLCPPGGPELITELSQLMRREPASESAPAAADNLVAVIREADCIGCALCLPPCPVDAIIGAKEQMHTVIAGECTGCELCIPACPVDCIELVPGPVREAPPSKRLRSQTAILPRNQASYGCINCGRCVPACPKQLLPDQLFKVLKADALDAAAALNLADCIECGLCDRVCPSQLPLANEFASGKIVQSQIELEAQAKATMKQRYGAHLEREAARATEQESRRAARLARLRKAPAAKADATKADATKADTAKADATKADAANADASQAASAKADRSDAVQETR